MDKVLIVGASSAIAQSIARRLAENHASLYLAGRNEEKLRIQADDLRVRGAKQVDYFVMDANELDRHATMVSRAAQSMEGLTMLIVAHGTLSDQKRAEKDIGYAVEQFQTNFVSAMVIITVVANHFEAQRSGTIVAIGSVAGDRGRQSNYAYGAAKAALATFVQGIRHRLALCGIKVVLVKPGFVDTPMTAGVKKNILFAAPDRISRDVMRAIAKDKRVIYTPWFWRYIMIVIKLIPERLFVRMRL
jgi:decaprenylphospho-beta-D-erythro-pentofuranosid-2-ulose 2-reductase